MKPLFVLFGVFFLCIIMSNLLKISSPYLLSGKIALAAMLLFTSAGHFMFTAGMSKMLPAFIPYRTATIYLTGLIEIAAAITLFIPACKKVTGIFLIVFFVAVLPANIYAAGKHLNYETGTFDGPGIRYLWFRIPFQILLIIWTYFFVVKS